MAREDGSKSSSLFFLGMAIRALRTSREMSQETLGAKAGIHATWISHIESGKVNPKLGHVARLSEALGVRLPDLVAFAEELEQRIESMTPPKG